MIVMKFGGTSVESAAAIERVAGIVRSRAKRAAPWWSSPPWARPPTSCWPSPAAAIEGKRDEYIRQLHDLRDFHSREARLVVPLAERAELDRILDEHFQELTELVKGLAVLGELTPRSIDAISSYGERLSSYIVTLAFRHFGMKAVHVDSRDVIVTDKRHTAGRAATSPRPTRAWRRPSRRWRRTSVVVMGGFIGSTDDGVTTTLGRGGSDFTASIVGAGIGAEEIQIWTDVDGMLTADPTILPGGHRVKTISFAEAAELAYFGAKVLHPATVVPAIEKNIPVLILNSRRPRSAPARASPPKPVPLRQRGEIDRLQAQDHAGQHSLDAHADGARLPAPDLRGLRPLRNAGGHGLDVRSQRLAHHRQHRATSTRSCARTAAVRRSRRWSTIRRSSAWSARISATRRAWRAASSTRSTASTSA